ncbi:metallophosphoesterase family protein [candidate division KSB1 bacterium]|nr:metallophosphoesterase family protein [candidate division KSB1 bacterium]
MRYAIISDIHSNFIALEQVLERIHSEKCDQIICLGDIVGYGPFPNECIELVKMKSDIVIAGNHDHAAAGLLETDHFNIYAKKAIEWTITALTEENKKYLQTLPLYEYTNDAFFVHSTPMIPERWGYILTPHQAKLNFDYFDQQICFIGHSHLPVIFSYNSKREPEMIYDPELKFDNNMKYIINVGSVGQPRDHSSQAAFGIYDTEKKSYKILRVSYDVYTIQKAMMSLDFPEFLIERLKYGR